MSLPEREPGPALLTNRDALVNRAMEMSRVTATSPLDCLELLARATGLVDAQHRAEQAEAEVARLDDNLRRRGAPPEERRVDIDDRYEEPEG